MQYYKDTLRSIIEAASMYTFLNFPAVIRRQKTSIFIILTEQNVCNIYLNFCTL